MTDNDGLRELMDAVRMLGDEAIRDGYYQSAYLVAVEAAAKKLLASRDAEIGRLREWIESVECCRKEYHLGEMCPLENEVSAALASKIPLSLIDAMRLRDHRVHRGRA